MKPEMSPLSSLQMHPKSLIGSFQPVFVIDVCLVLQSDCKFGSTQGLQNTALYSKSLVENLFFSFFSLNFSITKTLQLLCRCMDERHDVLTQCISATRNHIYNRTGKK